MVKSKINRVIIKATGPQPKATDLEGYTRYDIPWNDGTGEKLYIWMKPDGKSQDVFIGSDENLKVVTRSRDIIFKTNTAGVVSSSQAQATLRVIQTNAVYTYRLILSVDHETLTAAGGTAKVSAQLEAKIGDEIIYTKEVNPTITLQESTPGFSLNGSTLTVENRTTAIGNARTCTLLATVNTEETGEEVFSTIAVTQEGNYVESISLTKGNFSYANTVAAGQVVKPTSNGSTPVFTFTSGSTTTVVPSSTYGTVSRSTTYSSQASEGFSAANTETGAITVASRGTTIGNARTSNKVTRHESYSFVPSSSYNTKGQVDSELDSQATVTQAENVPVSVSVIPDFTYPSGDIPASGGTKTPSIDADITITWSSGGTSTADETGESGYTVTKTPNWSMTAAEGFTIDSSTGTVTAENRGTTEGDSYTSGDITLTSEVTINISEEYGGGSVSDEQEITKDDPVTQAPNRRIQVFSKPTITEFTVADIPAKGGTVNSGEVSYHQASTWYYDSGETAEGPSYTEGGSVQFGSAITAASLGTNVKSRSVVGTLTCTVSMNGQTSVEGDAVVYQQANAITSYGNVNLTVQTPINCDVLGGSYKITPTASQTITYTSEATRAGTIKLTYTQKSAMSGFSLSGQSVTVTENKSTSVRNGYTVTVTATGEGSKSASKEVVFNQAAGTKSYANPVISVFTYPTIAAKGGTVTPTIEYSQTWGWNDSTTDGGTITTGAALSFTGSKVTPEGSVSASTKGTNVSGVTTVDTVTLKVTLNNKSVTKAFTVQQAANAASYGNVTISGGTVADIPAAGGTISSMSGIRASQTITYTSEATRAGEVSITYSTAVKANSLNTTVKARTKVGTLTATATGEGSKSATKSVDVYQAANSATYGNVSITGGSVSVIPASGGSVSSASGISASQTVSFTSGATRAGSVSISYSTAVSASSKGTIISNQTTAGTLTATATGEGSKKATKQFTVYQAKNVPTTIVVGAGFSYPAGSIPASGGTKSPTLSGTVTLTWSSGSTSSSTAGSYTGYSVQSTRTWSMVAATGFSINTSTGVVTASNRGTTEGASRSCGNVSSTLTSTLTITSSYGGGTISDSDTKTLTTPVSQAANSLSYSYANPTVTVAAVSDIPASGGTKSSSTVTYKQVRTNSYTSGSSTTTELTSGGTVSWSDAISGSNLGTTAKARTKLGTLTATVTLNGKSGTGSVDVYQQANAITKTTYSTPTVTISSVADIPAKGGSVSTGTATYSQTKTDTYTSGSSKPTTLTSGGTVKWTTVSAGTKGTTVSARTEVDEITCTVTLNSKSGSATKMVYQAANSKNEVSRVITVSVPTGDIPAKGGTKTVTRSGVINYSFTSGATTTSSFTPTLSIEGTGFSLSGTTVTAANRTTVVGERRSATVTASYEGATSKEVTVWQQANAAVSITYGTPSVSLTVGEIAASGGTASSGIVTYSQSRTQNYTSGSTSPMSALTTGGIVSYSTAVSGSGLGTTIKNRTKIGTLTATVTMNGKSGSKSADVYQAGNYVKSVDLTGFAIAYSKVVSAAGGTVSPSVTQGSVKFTFTSGASSSTTPSSTYGSLASSITYSGSAANGFSAPNSSSGAMTASDRDTTEGASRSSGTVTATKKVTWTHASSYSGGGTKTDSMTDTDYATQQANVKTPTTISYGTWKVSVSANRYITSSLPCPAGGGTCTITRSASRTRTQNYSYTSGATSSTALSNETATPTLSISGTGASLSGTTVTWADRGATAGIARQATVTATYGGVEAKEIVYQAANSITSTIYGNPVVTITRVADIPASGGSVNTGSCTYSQSRTYTYSSGSTSAGSNLVSGGSVSWSTVSAGSKGTTLSERTSAGTITCTVTMNGKSGSKTATVYQAANEVTSSDFAFVASTSNVLAQGEDPFMFGIFSTFTITLSSGDGYKLGDNPQAVVPDWVTQLFTFTPNQSYTHITYLLDGYGVMLVGSVDANTGAQRTVSGSVKFNPTGESWSFSTYQNAAYYLDVSPTSLSFTASGGTKSISIDTNESWTIS